jgi:hypothetical protein
MRLRCIFGHDWRRVRFTDIAVIPTMGLSVGYELVDDGDEVICWRCGRERREAATGGERDG